MKEMEIEENLQRKQFTPAEEVLALSELHKLKQAKYGDSVQGKKGGWVLEDTADLVGKSKGLIPRPRLARDDFSFPLTARRPD